MNKRLTFKLQESKSLNLIISVNRGIAIPKNGIKKIQSLLLDQLTVMESMTPMDFLEFRDLLVPASGFQSVQFREIEIMLGLKTDQRI